MAYFKNEYLFSNGHPQQNCGVFLSFFLRAREDLIKHMKNQSQHATASDRTIQEEKHLLPHVDEEPVVPGAGGKKKNPQRDSPIMWMVVRPGLIPGCCWMVS